MACSVRLVCVVHLWPSDANVLLQFMSCFGWLPPLQSNMLRLLVGNLSSLMHVDVHVHVMPNITCVLWMSFFSDIVSGLFCLVGMCCSLVAC